MTAPTSSLGLTGPRVPQLDGLRGLAILMVVLYHSTELSYSEVPWIRTVLFVPWMGWAGVDLFFVLSGFLITRILLVRRGASNYFRAFYARRALRIFPLYYCLLCFFLIAVPGLGLFETYHQLWMPGADREAIWYWLFLGNYHAGLHGQFHHIALGITWSLAIEEQFYLVWPQLVSRVSVKTLKQVCYAVVVGSLLLRIVAVWMGSNWILTYTVTPFRLDGLAVGAWIATRAYEDDSFEGLSRLGNRFGPWAFGSLGLVVGLLIYDAHALGVEKSFTLLGHPLMQTFGYSAIAFSAGAVLIRLMSSEGNDFWSKVFAWSPLRGLGKISFGLYLVHVSVIQLIALHVYHPQDTQWVFAIEQLIYYFAVLAPSTAIAALSWWGFESRVLSWRRYVPFNDRNEDQMT